MLNYSIQQNGDFYEVSDNNLKMIIAAFTIESDAIDYFQQLLHAENNYIPPTYDELQAIIASVSRDNQQPQQLIQQPAPQLVPYPQFVPINYGTNNGEPTVSLKEVQNIMSNKAGVGSKNGGMGFDDNTLLLNKATFANGGAVLKDFRDKVNNMFDVTMDQTQSPTMELSRRDSPYSGIQKLKFNDRDLTFGDIDVTHEKKTNLDNAISHIEKEDNIANRFAKEDNIVHNFNDRTLFKNEKEHDPKESEGLKKAVHKLSDV